MERRTLLKLGAVTPAAMTLAAAGPAVADAQPQLGSILASNLEIPWGLDFLPDGSALVGERNSGRVLRVLATGGAMQVGTISGVFNNGGEGGLLGLAISPRFASDRWVYLYMSGEHENRVIRVKYEGGALGRREAVLRGIPRARHPQRRRPVVHQGLEPEPVRHHRRHPQLRPRSEQVLARRQDPATEAGRERAVRQPVRQPGLQLRAPQPRGHHRRAQRQDLGQRVRREHLGRAQRDPRPAATTAGRGRRAPTAAAGSPTPTRSGTRRTAPRAASRSATAGPGSAPCAGRASGRSTTAARTRSVASCTSTTSSVASAT